MRSSAEGGSSEGILCLEESFFQGDELASLETVHDEVQRTLASELGRDVDLGVLFEEHLRLHMNLLGLFQLLLVVLYALLRVLSLVTVGLKRYLAAAELAVDKRQIRIVDFEIAAA